MPIRLFPLIFLLIFSTSSSAIDSTEARHLILRTGFSPTPAELASVLPLGYRQAVDRLLFRGTGRAQTALPSWIDELPPAPRIRKAMSKDERKALRKKMRKRGLELRGWWLKEMVATPSPLMERMVLFWHNHFTSSLQKVRWPNLIYRQNRLLRRHALGNFRELLHAVTRDPAMVIYLDSSRNRKGKPNENFARELLELFTLGEGHYTEKDIKEAARAFTGWSVNRRNGDFRFRPRWHDAGNKTFMGRSGHFDGDHIIKILLEQPQTAELIVKKLWREFISPTPDLKQVKQFAALFRRNNYELKPLLRAMLLSRTFRDPTNRNTLIKSPVEYLVGTLRLLNIPLQGGQGLAFVSRRLGQDLLNPPNVKGWPGGNNWITSETLPLRRQMMQRLLRGMGSRGKGGMRKMRLGEPDDAPFRQLESQAMIDLVLGRPPVDGVDRSLGQQRLLRRLLLDPVYHLK